MSVPTRLSNRKRAAIIEAAVAQFDAHGFETTSMDAVAAQAGVSKRTVYNHFASKEELFRQIRNELVRRAHGVQPVLYDSGIPLDQQLSVIGWREMELLVSKEFITLARVTIPAMMTCQAFASETFSEIQGSHAGIVCWIEAAHSDGTLVVADARRAAKELIVLLNGFAFWPHIVGGQAIPDEPEQQRIVNATVQMFLSRYAV